MSYRQIVDANIGFSNPGSVKRAIDKHRAREIRTVAKDVIALDLERLDEYQQRATHALRSNGDLSQIDRLLRIMHERYGLLAISSEDVKQLREAHGISTQVTNNNSVMIVQTSETSEKEFIAQMMRAVNVDPESKEAEIYLQSRTVKEIESKKPTKKGRKVIVKKTKKTPASHISQSYGEIVEAEIVDEEILPPENE
jgi:hypothetical protein